MAKTKPKDNRHPDDIPRAGSTKLTPKVERIIVHAMGIGAHVNVAARAAGVSEDAIFAWLKTFPDFSAKIEAAKAVSAITAHYQINKAASDGNWRAAEWLLRKLFPREYGGTGIQINIPPRDNDEDSTVPNGSTVNITLSMPFLSGSEIRNDPNAFAAAESAMLSNARNANSGKSGPIKSSGNGNSMQQRQVASDQAPSVPQSKDNRLHPRTKPTASSPNPRPARKKRTP